MTITFEEYLKLEVVNESSTEIMEALDGNYDLHHLLGGGHGIRLLAIFVTALTGVGFHYATPKALNFIGALLYSLQKTLKII